MTQQLIRVVVADDHAVVRSGLADFLMVYEDMELVGEANNGRAAVDVCLRMQPDVVLMDMMMPEMDGATATHAIRERCPAIQVIALTSFREEELVNAALKAGAIGYLLKTVTADELAAAIRAAVIGRPTLASEATLALMHTATAPPLPGFDLTEREREVLCLMANGLNNRQIAQKLIVSLSTVKYHVSNIISKLGAANRTEAASIAMQNHLVS
ncbi:MAG: response regulator transcription factor [Chloroflexota bacterium]|nr:response regulator transcription factor [Chloroflexota bacterium]